MKNSKIYEADDRMISLIADNYDMLQSLGRFGINLGFGDKTVREPLQRGLYRVGHGMRHHRGDPAERDPFHAGKKVLSNDHTGAVSDLHRGRELSGICVPEQ